MYAALSQLLYLWDLDEQRDRGSKFKRRSNEAKGGNFYVGVDPSTILSELPISTPFGVIKVL